MPYFTVQNKNGGIHLLDNKGKEERRGRTTHHVIPDEVVLAIRTMHEIDRKTYNQVIAAYSQYSKHYIRSILNYELRAHLILKK